jgi:uncharacterized protein YdaU (DUF1376 family)
MHYYPHNIADYRKDTAHLTLMEHGIYRQLLDSYYLDEVPLSNDLAKLMRSHSVRSAEEQQSLQNVLTDFFELTESGYIHKRCDSVIAQYHGKSDKARASAMARWTNKDKASKISDANALPTQSKGNANGMLTNNHKPITNIYTNEFESFWKIYDKPVGKANAFKIWKSIKPNDDLVKTILQKATLQAKNVERKFRKDAERWLKDKRWEDEINVVKQVSNFDEMMRNAK